MTKGQRMAKECPRPTIKLPHEFYADHRAFRAAFDAYGNLSFYDDPFRSFIEMANARRFHKWLTDMLTEEGEAKT